MRAIILNDKNIIENIIIVDSIQDFPGAIEYVDGASIGDSIIDGVLVKNTNVSVEVPYSITPRQARLILLDKGLLDDVDTLVKEDRKLSIYWEYATEIVRTDPVLEELSTLIGLSDTDLDGLFIEASML